MHNKEFFFNEPIVIDTGKICLYSVCSPYPNHDVGFNWLNCDYPFLHQHDHWEIVVITKGQIKHTVNNKVIHMTKGDTVLLRPNDCHKFNFMETDADYQNLSFLIKSSYINDVFNVYSPDLAKKITSFEMPITIKLSEDETIEIINYALNFKSTKLDVNEKVYYSKILINKLINEIIKHISSLSIDNTTWLSDFMFLLNNPYTDTSDVTKLAATTPYSYANLSRIFKKATGRTIIEYSNHVKIKHAKDLLRVSDLNVLEITNLMNFNNVSYFNRLFKKHVGMSPSEYRKSVLQ